MSDLSRLVRPLVWNEAGCAEVLAFRYLLCDPESSDECNGWYVLEETTNTVIEADGSPEAAIAAAQADYTARILAALDSDAVAALMERAAQAAVDEYRDSQEQGWTFRREHVQNAVVRVIAAARLNGGDA